MLHRFHLDWDNLSLPSGLDIHGLGISRARLVAPIDSDNHLFIHHAIETVNPNNNELAQDLKTSEYMYICTEDYLTCVRT